LFINERTKPHELIYYEALSARTSLMKKESAKFENVKKGYEGEMLYDQIFDSIGHGNVLIYRDLFLSIDGSVTQYDTLIISDIGIISNEIKNFSGSVTFRDGSWYRGNFAIPNDAFSQLNRSVGKLMELRNTSRSDFKVSGKLIFPMTISLFILMTNRIGIKLYCVPVCATISASLINRELWLGIKRNIFHG
jgi:Nuclease-related domain.